MPSCGQRAMPMLASRLRATPPASRGSSVARRILRTTSRDSARPAPCTSTANSSRSSLATESPSRSTFCTRLPNSCSNRSPIWRPRVSLTCLNRSRFNTNTASSRVRVRRLGDRARQVVAEKDPVRQPGQRVVHGLAAHLALEQLTGLVRRFLARDVEDHPGCPKRNARGAEDRASVLAEPACLTAQVEHPVLRASSRSRARVRRRPRRPLWRGRQGG